MDDDKVVSIIPDCERYNVGMAAKEQLLLKSALFSLVGRAEKEKIVYEGNERCVLRQPTFSIGVKRPAAVMVTIHLQISLFAWKVPLGIESLLPQGDGQGFESVSRFSNRDAHLLLEQSALIISRVCAGCG